MFYGGENNVPGAPGNVGAYQNMFAGLDLPIPGGRLNRGGDLRNQTRPGNQTETLPTRPMLPGESRDGAIDIMFRQAMGMPGMMPMGNAGFFARPELGQLAANQGPSSPVKYDESMKGFVPNQGATFPSNIRYKNFPGV